MGACSIGKGASAPHLEMLKVFFLLQMLSKTLVYEVIMHHFEKMSSASGASPPDPHRGAALNPAGGLPSFRPLIAHP